MPTAVTILVVVAVGYIVGSIPVANLVARAAGAPDLRRVGDRNPGYWNAKQQVGRRAALPVFAGDVAKGAIAAAVGASMASDGQWWLAYVGGGAAMVGHAWPLLAGLRGGRSVLAFVGAAFVYAPLPALVAIASLVAVWSASRRFDVAARVGVACFPMWQLALDGPHRTAATGGLMAFIGFRFAQAALAARRTPFAAQG